MIKLTGHQRFVIYFIIPVAVIIFGGLIFMSARNEINNHRCERALGVGATFSASDECYPPPVKVKGLM